VARGALGNGGSGGWWGAGAAAELPEGRGTSSAWGALGEVDIEASISDSLSGSGKY